MGDDWAGEERLKRIETDLRLVDTLARDGGSSEWAGWEDVVKGVGTITSALWVAVAVVALLFFGACSDQKYDLQHTNFRLSSYSNYLEDLGRSSSSSDPLMQALYEGRYPPNISEPANGVERFLIAPDFRVSPFIR